MSWLLPDAVRDAITSRGTFQASATFGLVTLAVLIIVLLEHEIHRATSADKERRAPLLASAVALSVPVVLVVVVRIAHFLP